MSIVNEDERVMVEKVGVISSAHKLSDGRIFHRQCVTLAVNGYDVTYVAPASFREKKRLGVTVRGVKPAGGRKGRPLVWLRLFRELLRMRPQVVHFHDPELLLLMPFVKLWLGRRTTTIYDVHEYFIDSLADKYWIPGPIRGLAMRLAAVLERLLLNWVDAIVCAVDGLVPLYRGSGKPIAVVRNLPRAALFQDARPHPALDICGFKLIYAGLILPKRGINVLLEAMRLLNASNPDVRLFLLGDATSADYMTFIRQFCEEHQLIDHVKWLGPVPHDEVKNYLAGADVGLLPGIKTRQYSNPGIATKVFEYMLCSLPIVSADFPQGRDHILEAECGVLVGPENVDDHVAAIAYLAANKDEASAMGKRGQAYALENYTWEADGKRLTDFYRRLTLEKLAR
jgi:glycosyltransferase involved in cell wall biosynthesis